MPDPTPTPQTDRCGNDVETASDGFPVSRIVDGLFLAGALATVIYWVSLTPGSWFFTDDWSIAYQAMSLRGLFLPYNGHLAATTLASYRVLFDLFGFRTYLPWRILGAVMIASVGVSIYLTSRRRIGSPLAALVGMVMLWQNGLDPQVSPVALYASLTTGIWCAYVLNKTESRRADIILFVLLTLSLASSDVGVPVALACLVFCGCTRPSRRRWLAAIIPTMAWGIWWLTLARGKGDLLTSDASQFLRLLLFNLENTFVHVAFGSPLLAVPVAVFVLVRLVRLTRRGLDESANALSWVTALGVFWIGIAWTRPTVAEFITFRYSFVIFGFVVLALLPRRPLEAQVIAAVSTARHWRAAALGIGVVSAGIVIVIGIGPLRTDSNDFKDFGSETSSIAAVVNLGPAAVPDNLELHGYYYRVTAGQVREMFRFYGGMPVTPEAKNKAIVTLIQPSALPPGVSTSRCPITTLPTRFREGSLVLSSDEQPVVVYARFGTATRIPLASIDAHQSERFLIPPQFGALMTLSVEPANAPIHAGSLSGGKVACIDGDP